MNSMLKHYDKAVMIMHQFAMDEYFLYEVLFHHFRKKRKREGGGEGKKGIFLVKIVALPLLKSALCRRLEFRDLGKDNTFEFLGSESSCVSAVL